MSTELRDLLELASEDLPEVDLVDRAWEAAEGERRAVRRRVLLGAGGLAAAGALATVVLGRDDRAAVPAATPSPSSGLGATLNERLAGTVRVSMAPSPFDEAALPRYPDAGLLALPELLGPGEQAARAALGPGGTPGSDASVRAVFLVHAPGGGYQPVVLLPHGSPNILAATAVLLERVHDSTGAGGPVLGPRTIHDDRHRVVFAQRGGVVVLDVRDASVLELPVPDDGLLHAGWARDGRTVIARSGERDWLVDTQTHQVRRPDVPARPDYEDIAQTADGDTVLRSFAGSGTLSETRVVPGTAPQPYGESSANIEAWVASGVYFDDSLTDELQSFQGLLAVQDDLSITPRVLAAVDEPGVPKQVYRPLGWGPRDTLLLESGVLRGADGGKRSRILAWDVIGARLYTVAELSYSASGDGEFSGSFAI